MNPSNVSLLLFSLILAVFIPKLIIAQFSSFNQSWCSDNTYPPESTYQSNLQTVLNLLSNDSRITYGFYNFTVGREPNRVSSLALCRGDVPINTCRLCMRNAATLLPQVCPNNIEAFGYSTYCSIFISNRSIYGKLQDITPPVFNFSGQNVPSAVDFDKALNSFMRSLQKRAASGNSELKYAAGNVNLTGGLMLYGLVQCTPDLSREDCMKCIEEYFIELSWCCVLPNYKASGIQMVEQSCIARYDINSFFGDVPNFSLPPPLVSQPSYSISSNSTAVQNSEKSRNVGAISVTLGVATILVLSIVLIILSRRKRLRKSSLGKLSEEEVEDLKSLQFSLGTIKHATQNFSDDYKLGEGGFGSVYKGILPDGQEIAVKRLLKNSGQGDAEFKNEILILAELRHTNLVKLLGFCLHKKEMILIYELVANRSLDNFIFDPLSRQSIQWETRYKIINGIARGILYLHENSRLKIIHRDLKAANVLLDEDFYPKIADFGMARLFNIDQTQTLASKIVGTLGYISPEYALQRQISVKSDVYSFGVLILEIVSGQKITSFMYEENQENLLSFAWRNWNEGTAWNLVDPAIAAGSSTELLKCIHIGLLCVQDNPADRPTMSSVDLMLSNSSVTLQAPSRPAFFTHSHCLSNMHSQPSSRFEGSVNFVSITELHPR